VGTGRPARFGVPRCGAKNAKGVLQGSVPLPIQYPVRPALGTKNGQHRDSSKCTY
jgi:hypothetical protein